MTCNAHNGTTYLGSVVLDAQYRRVGPPASGDKVDCELDLVLGGGAYNAAMADQVAGGRSRLCALTGDDPLGRFIGDLLEQEMSRSRRIAAGTRSRLSAIVPVNGDPAAIKTFTNRPRLNSGQVRDPLREAAADSHRLVLCSMTAADAPLVGELMGGHSGEAVLLLTKSQCEDRETTFGLGRRAKFVFCNLSELETLTEVQNGILLAITAARDKGISGIVVTAGMHGIYGYLDGQWLYAPAFDLNANGSPSKCGDIVLGTFLCGLERGESPQESLRIAAAAAAMHAAGIARRGGWDELRGFADRTPVRRFKPPEHPAARSRRLRIPAIPERLRPAAYAAVGAALGLVLTIPLW